MESMEEFNVLFNVLIPKTYKYQVFDGFCYKNKKEAVKRG